MLRWESRIFHIYFNTSLQVDGDEDDEDQVGMGGNKDVGSGSEDEEDDKKKGSGDDEGSDEEWTGKILVHCDPFLLAYDPPVILPATIFVFCIYCLPIQSLGVVKNAPSNDELSYLYAPASMQVLLSKYFALKYLLHLGTLIYASSIYMQWWCSSCAGDQSCAAVFPSIAVLQYFQVPP